jgi:hypothetical protein
LGGLSIEAAARRLRRFEAELIREELVKLWRDAIGGLPDHQADARIDERTVAAHLPHADVAVPV